VAILLVAFAVIRFVRIIHGTAPDRLDFASLFANWSSVGISYASTILGFLLAGFAVLFAVLRPSTAVLLRHIRRPGEKSDELKLLFVNFVGVFVQYTAFLFWCVVYMAAGSTDGAFDAAGRILSEWNEPIPVAITHAVFVIWGLWFVVLILSLKSFIYNLYQTLLLGLADAMEEFENEHQIEPRM
jgi:hypothetical protein